MPQQSATRTYGYARVSKRSTENADNLRSQVELLEKAGVPPANIYAEEFTGGRFDRREWLALHSVLKPGDTIYFEDLTRAGRNTRALLEFAQWARDNSVSAWFIRENLKLDGSPQGELTYTILSAIATFQLRLVAEKSKAGQERARDAGKPIGRPLSTTLAQRREIRRQLDNNASVRSLARATGKSTSTIRAIRDSQD